MKKILLILGLALLVTSCGENCGCNRTYKEVPAEKALWISDEFMTIPGPANSDGEVRTARMEVITFSIEGHHYKYVFLDVPSSPRYVEGITHDPKCPACKEQSKKSTTPVYSPSSDYESLFGSF